MLTEKMLDKLNEQINVEFYSSNLYLQMASWCESQGLEGCSEFLKAHALVDEADVLNRAIAELNCNAPKAGNFSAMTSSFSLNFRERFLA